MSEHSLARKLIKVIKGTYRPKEGEISLLAEVAKQNKIYLAFLRRIYNNNPRRELLAEETMFKNYMKNVVDVVKAFRGLRYALYKFRRPLDHVSVDLDILIHVDEVPEAISRLRSMGFEIDIVEPYTATLRRKKFIVDLYTHPAFAWIVYMNGQSLLNDYSEEFEVNGILARGVVKDAEVVVTAAHAIYKEHMILLLDCLTITEWFSGKVINIARELAVKKSLDIAQDACKAIEQGLAEAPYKITFPYIALLYLDKAITDSWFRATIPNILKYLVKRKHSGYMVLWRLTRESY